VAAFATASLLLLISFFLWRHAWPMLSGEGWQRFFADQQWHPLEQQFGMMPMVAASLLMAVGALLLAGPLGLLCALFAHFYAPPALAKPFRRMIGLLAGVPSVVYGLWGLTVLVPLIAQWEPPGASLLAGILILAMMVLPTVALLCEAALRSVPANYQFGAAALGLTKKGMVLRVVLPSVRPNLIAAVLLGAGRALGETMAVVMVAGNIVQFPSRLFDPVRVLTANIAMEMAYAVGDHRASLFVSGLILIGLVALLAGLAFLVQKGSNRV
jgi:phosphate transport system permease protein